MDEAFLEGKPKAIFAKIALREAGVIEPDLSVADRIERMIEAEVSVAPTGSRVQWETLAAFQTARVRPFETTVNFSGGVIQRCWTVTRSDGAYRVVYLPRAGYFALCAESDFGPLDIGVHGPALGCFASV